LTTSSGFARHPSEGGELEQCGGSNIPLRGGTPNRTYGDSAASGTSGCRAIHGAIVEPPRGGVVQLVGRMEHQN